MRPKDLVLLRQQAEDKTYSFMYRLKDQIRENDRVSYEVQNGKKGLNAVNVKVI